MGPAIEVLQVALAGRYVIAGQVGYGGMSVVYRARDVKHDRDVAIKLLSPELAESIGSERFLREIRIAARFQHPHILPLYDSGEAAGTLYYVMPYVEGESLRSRLTREKQLPLKQALRITREVAEGLSYAHAHGVVHRDVKPENILVSGGHAALADFGIARAVTAAAGGKLTGPGLTVGTPAYMSPEQASGDATVDGRSDLYSLGCVVYEMLAGEPPFTGPSGQAILARILSEPPRSLRVIRPTVPARIEQAIERALAKVPADRFATAAQFAEALTLGEDAAPSTPRRVGMRPAALAMLVALAVSGAALTVWSRWGQRAGGPTTAPELDPTRIAVLYFEDLSQGGTLRHVAHGLTEELIDELGGVSALHVVSPSGVQPYSGRDIPLDSIARALRVGTLVEGSIARPGNRLRVSVRLIDAKTGEQLVSNVLERPWGDLFALERDVTDEVSRFLRERLGKAIELRERRAGTKSVAAWELVRRAEQRREEAQDLAHAGHRREASGVAEHADSLLQRAEQLDAKWTEPVIQRGWLARFHADLSYDERRSAGGREGTGGTAPALQRGEIAWLRDGLSHAERALRIKPNDPRALELRGYLRFLLWQFSEGDSAQNPGLLDAAERDLNAAVGQDPGLARALNALSLVYHQQGDFARATITLQRALEADAYLSEAAANIELLMFALLERGETQAATSWCRTGRARFPSYPTFAQCELVVLGWAGGSARDAAHAWRLLRDIEQRDSAGILANTWAFRRMMVAAVLARAGLADSAKRVVRAVETNVPNPAQLRGIELYEAYVHTLLGEDAAALRLLEAYLRGAPQDRSYVASTRWFLALRGNPRFQALVHPAAPSP